MSPIADATGTETVLLVEDEDALRAAAKRILAGAGYQVLTASNGREALELAKAHPEPIDLLLTDVVMPEMLGHRLAANLVSLRPTLRVLYMSGFAEPFLDRSMHVEDADLIEKPFTAPALLARVRRALG
jgi:DNA-binding NtrC family response regulator